jgi:curved DNA-binding protein CbpA
MNNKDYYQILGVDSNATEKEIRQSYRKLAFQYHPDKNKDNPAASEKMKEFNEAYAILSNPVKRREYDSLRDRFGSTAYDQFRQTHSEEDIFKGSDINQIFDEFAKMYGFRSADDILGQFYGQGYRTFEFSRPGMFGKGFIFYGFPNQPRFGNQIPDSTMQQISQVPFTGILGNTVKFFLKKGLGIQIPERGKDWTDTVTLIPDSINESGEIEYIHKKHKQSKKLMVKIPPEIQNGQRIRLKGMGSQGKNGGANGDLYLKVKIKTPLPDSIRKSLKTNKPDQPPG